MAGPGLEKKPFHGREWVFLKLAHCLEQRPISKTCGAVVVGGPGSGKTALCSEIVWPGCGGICRAQRALRRRLLAYHFCQAHNAASLSPAEFVRRIVSQLLGQADDDSPTDGDHRSPTFPSSFLAVNYADKIRKDADIQAVLRPDFIERDPDEALKKGVLFPLLEIDPPKHCMFLLVDSIDEHQLQSSSGRKPDTRTVNGGSSTTIAELLGSHHHLFPQWLMLVCTSRRQSKNISKMFTGFRKLTLDDLRKSHVVRDVQQYILARVHSEDGLRSGMRRETVEMLNQLQIKSAGCFLYLERVLDGLRERLMLARDLKEIPGTLNGLYLWLCQRLFHSQHLSKIQPILNVILASRRPLTISEVYEAVWTHNTKMSRQSFTNRLQLLRRVLRLHNNGTLLLFHHSFAEWLLDVKHCTRKYLCSADDGHAMLAMSMTLRAKTLPPDEIQSFALHLTRIPLPQQNILDALPIDYNTLIVLWLVQSGAKVENCLLADEKPVVEVVEARKSKRVSKTRKTKDNQYEKLKESYEELEFEPYGRRDLERNSKSNDDYDHLEFDLVKQSSTIKEETFDKSPEFLKDINEQNFKFSTTTGDSQNHVKLDSEDSGFLKSEDASTLGVTTTTMSSSNELKENISRDEELELLLNGLEKSLNEDSFLSSVISLKPESDVPIPKDPTVLKILTEAGAKVSNCNSLSRDGGLSSQASRVGSPDGEEVDPLQELLNSLNGESGPLDGRLLHAVASQDNPTLLQLVLTTYPELELEAEDRHGQTALNLAARHGYLQVLEGLLDAGADVNHSDCEGWTALRAAAWGGHTSVVELLLTRGADVDVADSDQRTALRAAAWGGHDAIVKLLIAHNADVNHTDEEGRTALIAASYMGHASIVEHLLDNGADIDQKDVDGRTALSVAALCVPHSEGYIKVVNLLLERGATVDHQDKDGMTPLLVAAFEGHRDVCELLLEYEADVDHADRSGRTPLWAAASMGHAAVVNLLLFWGCYVDSIDNEGRTVLSVAAAQGNTAVVKQLVDRGLDEQHRDNSGWTPLHYAAFEGHLEVCEALLEGGGRVDEPDNDGKGALHLAAQEGHVSLVQALLEVYNAPPDQRAHDGKTPLRLAALEGHYEIVRILLGHNADVNAKDADGRTTLYVLALENRLPMTRFLLEHGQPDVESRDTEGRTALHVSAWQGHFDMVRLLLTLGRGAVDGVDRENRTSLHSASWQGHAAIVQLLLDQGASPDHTCNQGATALGIAAQEGHEDCVRVLLEHGADPAHSDHCGRNAFRVAVKSGHDAVVRLLQEHSTRMECVKPSAPEMTASFLESDSKYLSLAQHSIHSKSSSNLTNSTKSSKDQHVSALTQQQGLSFTQQLQMASSRGARHPATPEVVSPIYASPPHSPLSDINSPETEIPPVAPTLADTDLHFARDTHMRIILGNSRGEPIPSQKPKRNGIVTNPALRLMSNVKNGLENAAERIHRSRHEGGRSNQSRHREGKINGHWKKETPL